VRQRTRPAKIATGPARNAASRGPLGAALILALLCSGWARGAQAAIAVFTDGRIVKIAGYRVLDGRSVEIDLPGGGSYTTSILRIERFVEDEVPPTPAERLPAASAAADLSFRAGVAPLFGTPYDGAILAAARRFNVDAALVSAVIKAESNYDPHAVSRKGARGLMQLMPATSQRLAVRRPFDPGANIDGGVRYLRELIDRFGSKPELVLAAYNAGEDAVEAYGGVPPYRETVTYVRRILALWKPSAPAEAAEARSAGS
jgi:Transglycosylase SLT domain